MPMYLNDEHKELTLLRMGLWTDEEWNDVARFFEDDPFRCPPPGTHYPSGTLEYEGDLPAGSWYQQSNGGSRSWTAVHGEFVAKPVGGSADPAK